MHSHRSGEFKHQISYICIPFTDQNVFIYTYALKCFCKIKSAQVHKHKLMIVTFGVFRPYWNNWMPFETIYNTCVAFRSHINVLLYIVMHISQISQDNGNYMQDSHSDMIQIISLLIFYNKLYIVVPKKIQHSTPTNYFPKHY